MAKKGNFTHDNKNNKTDVWVTPRWVFEALGLEFDVDPCSPEGGVQWIPCKKYYTEKDNGLIQPWEGRVWLNPPYGNQTEKWLAKMHEHRNGIALVFARTDNAWFHEYLSKADALLFLQGRIKFVDWHGVTQSKGGGAGSVFAAWGSDNVAALRAMAGQRALFVELNQYKIVDYADWEDELDQQMGMSELAGVPKETIWQQIQDYAKLEGVVLINAPWQQKAYFQDNLF